MPIPESVRAILGNVWASAPGALKQDPSAADPAIDREDGYPAAFSANLVPEQETIQGRWNEFDSAIDDIYTSGVPFYDDEIDYPQHAITNEDGSLYRAVVANGPTAGNVTTPGTNVAVWARVSGTQATPSAPDQPTATSPAAGQLDIIWNCPLDGGAAITAFTLDWRLAGQTWAMATRVTGLTHPSETLTGLTNGTAVEFRVRATNAIGDSAWSATGTGTPTAQAPNGGSALALMAREADGEVVLNWLEPDDNGATITAYHVQWRTSGQTFAGTRQRNVTATSDTVPTLTNGTAYFFRVRAANSVGNSTWSNEATATPAPSEHRVTTAGMTTFSWPWAGSTSARVMVQGGGGGGAGGNQVGGAASGEASSVTGNSQTVSASGGLAGGANASGLITGDIQTAGSNGGSGGGPTTGGSRGDAGRGGDVTVGNLTGLSVGDSLTVVVGAGGAGGVSAPPGDDGSAGGSGQALIVPVY